MAGVLWPLVLPVLDSGREVALPLLGVTEGPGRKRASGCRHRGPQSLPLSVIPIQTSPCPTSPMTATRKTILPGVLPCVQEGPLLFGNCNQEDGHRLCPKNAISQAVSSRSASADVGHVQNRNQVVRHPRKQGRGLQAERQAAVCTPPNPEEVGQEATWT